jgi:hypothetical protein
VAAGVWAMTGAASIEAATRAMATLRNMDIYLSENWLAFGRREAGLSTGS